MTSKLQKQPSETTEAAVDLKELIEDAGSISEDAVKDWLEENGVPGNKWGFVIGYGSNGKRGWWHKKDGYLYAGPKDGAQSGQSPSDILPPPDPEALDTPRDQFEATARQLGIAAKPAAAVASYVAGNYDLNDPEAVWKGLIEAHQIVPGQRKQLWRTWVSFIGIEPVAELTAQVETHATPVDSASLNGSTKTGRQFIAVKGEVFPAEPGDEGGVSFSQALQLAQLQSGGKSGSDGVTGAVIRELGESSRSSLGVLSEAMKPRDDGSMTTILGLVMSNIEANRGAEREARDADRARADQQLELSREQHKHEMELMREQNNHAMEKISESIGSLTQPQVSPFDQIDKMLPGMGAAMLERFLNPPKPSPTIMSGLTGADGQPLPVDLETYKTLKGIEQKDALLKQARDQFPQFLKVGERIAQSMDRAKKDRSGSAPEPEQFVQTDCVNPECGTTLSHSPNVEAIQCPVCGAIKSPTGEWLNDPKAYKQEVIDIDEVQQDDQPAEPVHEGDELHGGHDTIVDTPLEPIAPENLEEEEVQEPLLEQEPEKVPA